MKPASGIGSRRSLPAPAAQGWVEALHALGAAYVAWGIRNPEMYRLIFMGDADFTMAAFEKQDENSAGIKAWAVLLDIAARVQREGFMRHASGAELAELIWMMLHGIVSLHITCVRRQLSVRKAGETGDPNAGHGFPARCCEADIIRIQALTLR